MNTKQAKAGQGIFVAPPGLSQYADMVVTAALAEDVGAGDITTDAIVEPHKIGKCAIVAREPMVVAGHFVAKKVFEQIDEGLKYEVFIKDAQEARRGDIIATVSGRLRAILIAERVALNFLQRLSGIASLTADFVRETKGYKAEILDTRKTTPCLRLLERYAVITGGGVNHRMGLFDAVLIKDNHISAVGGVIKAVEKVKKTVPKGTLIEVEASSLDEVEDILSIGADIILLDNMGIEMLSSAVKAIGDEALSEASGGIDITNVREVAQTGVDRISVGAITHSARAVDLSLNVES